MSEWAPEPPDGDERSILLGWLAFQRDTLRAKCDGLSAEQLVMRAAPPSALSLLGLVRHMAEMERVYGAWGNGPKQPLQWVWGDYEDDGPEWDFDVEASMRDESFTAWTNEIRATDQRIESADGLDVVGGGNGHTLRWNLHKLLGEYARHNGHADLLRERIDGLTGE